MQDRLVLLQKQNMNLALMRRVAEVLMSYGPEAFRAIDIDARGKVVILKGRVVGEENRNLALELARTTAGVEEVIDRLTIVARARPVVVAETIVTPTKKDSVWTRGLVLVSLLGVISSSVLSMVKEPGSFVAEESASAAVVVQEKSTVYPVEGTLFVEGRPAVGAQVVFHPVAGFGEPPCLASAIVGHDGRFTLRSIDNRYGATAGKFAVTVAWYRPIPPGEEMSPEEAGSLVPPRFRKLHTTPLRVNIKPEQSTDPSTESSVVQLPPIHLTQQPGVRRT